MKRTAVYMGGFLALACSLALSQTAFAGGSALTVKQYSLGQKDVADGQKHVLVNATTIQSGYDVDIYRTVFSCSGDGEFENFKMYQDGVRLEDPVQNYTSSDGQLHKEFFFADIALSAGESTHIRIYADDGAGEQTGTLACAITNINATFAGTNENAAHYGNMRFSEQKTLFHFDQKEDPCVNSHSAGGEEAICVGEVYTYDPLNLISTNLYANDRVALVRTNAWTGTYSPYVVIAKGEQVVLTAKSGDYTVVQYNGLVDGIPTFVFSELMHHV